MFYKCVLAVINRQHLWTKYWLKYHVYRPQWIINVDILEVPI